MHVFTAHAETTSVSGNVNTLVWEQSQDHARCSDSTTDYQILTCPTYYNETGTHLTVLNIPEGHYEMVCSTITVHRFILTLPFRVMRLCQQLSTTMSQMQLVSKTSLYMSLFI